jgi:hypothetical protein
MKYLLEMGFEEHLKSHFNLENIGHVHWYLGTRFNRLSNFDIELDQSCYCMAIVKKYLDTAGASGQETHTLHLQ